MCDFNKEKFEKIIDICSLQTDIELLPSLFLFKI
jgi:hypothetical protein